MYQAGQLKQYRSRCFYFIATGNLTGNGPDWNAWTIPKEARFVSLLLIGAGAGGGSGNVTATASGGCGGGGGAVTSALFHARDLPATLYFLLYPGGLGGAASTGSANAGTGGGAPSGSSGLASVICSYPILSALPTPGTILAANGGNTGSTGLNAGSSASVITVANFGYYQRAINFNAVTGQVNLAGSTGTPSSIQQTATGQGGYAVTAGASGGGANSGGGSNGGKVVPNDLIFAGNGANVVMSQGGIAGGFLNGANGFDTFLNCKPFGNSESPWQSWGGAGGAGDLTTGGNGGNGGIGAGGGGGGGAFTGGTSGAGGNGGPAFCLVEWW